MTESLLDTDIFSEVQKGRDLEVRRRAAAYRAAYGTYTVSLFTVFEAVKGYQKRQAEQRIQALKAALPRLNVVGFDAATAELAGRIHGDLERTGQTIGRMDPLIAATALRHDLTLITGNTRHYQRIIHLGYPLRLDDWRQPAETDDSAPSAAAAA